MVGQAFSWKFPSFLSRGLSSPVVPAYNGASLSPPEPAPPHDHEHSDLHRATGAPCYRRLSKLPVVICELARRTSLSVTTQAVNSVTVYVFISDLSEHAELAEGFERFTDVRPSRPSLAERQIVLVSFDGTSIAACGRMTRGRKAANYRWHVTLDELVLFDEAVMFDDLAGALDARGAQALQAAVRSPGGQLKDPIGEDVLEALTRLRPGIDDVLTYLRQVSGRHRRRPMSDREPVIAYERDAVGLALELADLGHERISALSAWDGRTDEPFLSTIAEYTVLEDRAIEHDARVFGDWPLIKGAMAGVTRFESRGRRVTIINVNRAGIEHALGVDLIYYTQQYDAYVVVQYKRRERGGTDERWVFRPDASFDNELKRMRGLTLSTGANAAPHSFRLDERCCFLKICATSTPEAFSSELVRGAYLPLAYWDCLETSGALIGPRDGRVLTDRSVGRYLTNTQFIDLVKAAWIGSRGETSATIQKIVEAGLRSNKSLILASATANG